jgi:hypothetical protein
MATGVRRRGDDLQPLEGGIGGGGGGGGGGAGGFRSAKVNAERKSSQPSDVDAQYSRHLQLKEKGFYDESKTKDERLQIIKELGLKKGGSVSARADGIAQRGKTRGKIC